jgi:hypothetical protein
LQPTPAETFAALSAYLTVDSVTYNTISDADIVANRAQLDVGVLSAWMALSAY